MHVDESRPGVVQAFVGAATTHFVPYRHRLARAAHPRFDEKAARAAPDTAPATAPRGGLRVDPRDGVDAVRDPGGRALLKTTRSRRRATRPRTGGRPHRRRAGRLPQVSTDALRCERTSPDAAVAVMACSRFVLAPRGHMLHSSRLLEALSIGAVPVVVSDGWVLPFEHDLVDWAAVAIRVAEADAGRVADILRTVSDERWCAMQRAGRRAYADILSKPVDALVRVFEKRRATSDS